MEVEIGVGPQSQKVVVVVGGRDGGDGDIAGLGSRCQQRPCPTKSLDYFMIGGRRTDGGDCRRLRFRPNNLDALAIEPMGNGSRAGVPSHLHARSERMQQGPPAWRQLSDPDNLDRAK